MTKYCNTSWFAIAVRRRRLDLRLRKYDMAERGGPSRKTMYKIESGTGALTDAALSRIEDALQWRRGAARRALDPHISSVEEVLNAVGYDGRRIPPRGPRKRRPPM
jgi:DNA-binding XRE family transcriptional regulator